MPFEDKLIVCEDCSQEFVHSAEDQTRYAERGFTHDPKRCRECREKRKTQSAGARGRRPSRPGGGRRGGGGGGGGGGQGGGGGRPRRESFETTCAACGVVTTVPFRPRGERPVYCRDCYRERRV